MEIRKDKSGILFRRCRDHREVSRNGEITDIKGYSLVEEYKYLGLTLCRNLSLTKHFKNMR